MNTELGEQSKSPQSALARKFGDVYGRRTRSLLAASRCPFGAETERCSSSGARACALAGTALATTRKQKRRPECHCLSGENRSHHNRSAVQRSPQPQRRLRVTTPWGDESRRVSRTVLP